MSNLDISSTAIEEINDAVRSNNYTTAENLCAQILQKDNNHIAALKIMAQLLLRNGAYHKTFQILTRGIKLAPKNIDFWYILTDLNTLTGNHPKRIKAALKASEICPELPKTWLNLATAFASAGKYEEALNAYDIADEKDANNASIQLQRGHMLKTLGQRKECEEAYHRSASLFALNGSAYWGLANLKNLNFTDRDMKKIKSIISNKQTQPEQVVQAEFALAKAYEDRKKFNTAFKHYNNANTARSKVKFDIGQFKLQCDTTSSALTKDELSRNIKIKPLPSTPIFIVGLPRSGSTLVEQILASHSNIEGTMELQTLPLILHRLNNKAKVEGITTRDYLKKLNNQELEFIGRSYINETAIFRTDKPFFIDKLPSNFRFIDIIHLILPSAIIIDARRHPLDTGLSVFKQHFATGQDFSYNLEHIGEYYKGYLKLMDHWDDALISKVLCVRYEDLVLNTKQQVERLLGHCGLRFEKQCLEFYNNKRAVNTASSEQVRQPLHTNGIEYWRNFEKHLEPLIEALGEETLSRFDD